MLVLFLACFFLSLFFITHWVAYWWPWVCMLRFRLGFTDSGRSGVFGEYHSALVDDLFPFLSPCEDLVIFLSYCYCNKSRHLWYLVLVLIKLDDYEFLSLDLMNWGLAYFSENTSPTLVTYPVVCIWYAGRDTSPKELV